jgi:hypothetical protein
MTQTIFNSIRVQNKFETDLSYGFIFDYAILDERHVIERLMDSMSAGSKVDLYALSFNIEKDDINYQVTITFPKTD